jgi:hypothetical protein
MENLPYIQYYTLPDDLSNFSAKLVLIANKLGWATDWLPKIMFHESGMDPAIVNQNGSGATGLIQFMPDTAIGLGTTVADLANMTGTDQLDYVLKYYQQLQQTYGIAPSLADAYIITFYPAAFGQAPTYVLGGSGTARASKIASENPTMDSGNKGYITKQDIINFVNKW